MSEHLDFFCGRVVGQALPQVVQRQRAVLVVVNLRELLCKCVGNDETRTMCCTCESFELLVVDALLELLDLPVAMCGDVR